MPYHSIRNNTYTLAVCLSLAVATVTCPAWAQDTTVTQEKAKQEKSGKEAAKPSKKAKEARKAKKGEAMPESPAGAEEGKGVAGSAAGAGKKNGETEHYSVCSSKPWLCK